MLKHKKRAGYSNELCSVQNILIYYLLLLFNHKLSKVSKGNLDTFWDCSSIIFLQIRSPPCHATDNQMACNLPTWLVYKAF